MRVTEVATGLWHWTGLHPDWTPAHGGADGWEQEVGCVYYEAPTAVVLVDPLVPAADERRFYEALDRDVARVGLPVRILLTTVSHRRSSKELARRYRSTIGNVPAGVETCVSVWGEKVYWISEHRALVFGDVVVGRDGGLQLPHAWLGAEYDEVAEGLRPLLDLPIERVLVTHGEPVLADGRAALAGALSV